MIKKIYIFILTLNICLGFSLHAEESKNDITKITSDGSIKLFQNDEDSKYITENNRDFLEETGRDLEYFEKFSELLSNHINVLERQ